MRPRLTLARLTQVTGRTARLSIHFSPTTILSNGFDDNIGAVVTMARRTFAWHLSAAGKVNLTLLYIGIAPGLSLVIWCEGGMTRTPAIRSAKIIEAPRIGR